MGLIGPELDKSVVKVAEGAWQSYQWSEWVTVPHLGMIPRH